MSTSDPTLPGQAEGVAAPHRPAQMSLTTRAFLAVGLTLGFYLLALCVAAVLLYLPYVQWTYTGRVNAHVAVFCVAGALGILWSILPRPERFVPPGPRLEALTQPELFHVLRDVAAATGQRMPAEVYLVPDLNAWVRDRSGVFGLGSRRLMGLGLPLLQLLSVDQFRAVLAHEFGHYVGGDTKLGPWIYRTRAAIGRTLMRLHGSLLQKPFVLYGELFLRITLAISRRQELAADMLAARVTGPLQLIDGLKAVHAAAPAFERYWQSEVVPLLSQGYRPPIAAGFERFVAASPVASVLQQHLEREVTEGEAHPYDTHPALRERIAALQALSATQAIPDHRRAICLLADVDALEVELLGSIGTPAAVLRRLAWDDVGAAVYLPMWEQASAQYAAAFDGLTPAAFPLAAEKLEVYAERFQHERTPI
jgi:Zn-dependent protease with chaperone function